MKLQKAISILEEWRTLAYHNDDGTDEDSHDLLMALDTVLPVLRNTMPEGKSVQRDEN